GADNLDSLGPLALSPGGRELAVGMPPPTSEPVALLDPVTLRPTGRHPPGFTKAPAGATHVRYSRDGHSLVAMIQYYGNGPTRDFSSGAVFFLNLAPGGPASLRKVVRLPAVAVQGVVLAPGGDRFYLTKPVA